MMMMIIITDDNNYLMNQGEADRLCVPDGGVSGHAYCRSATTRPSADTLAATRRRRSSAGSPTGRGRRATSSPGCCPARSAKAPRRATWAPAACDTPFPSPLAGAAGSGSTGCWAFLFYSFYFIDCRNS